MPGRGPLEGFRKETYGDLIADVYDDLHSTPELDPTAEVTLLTELARGGKALELGIGTGRVALPLSTWLGSRNPAPHIRRYERDAP